MGKKNASCWFLSLSLSPSGSVAAFSSFYLLEFDPIRSDPMEAEQQRQRRKGQKRKLEEEGSNGAVAADASPSSMEVEPEEMGVEEICCHRSHQSIDREVRTQVEVLERAFSWRLADRAAAKRATHVLAELAKNGLRKLLFPYNLGLSCVGFVFVVSEFILSSAGGSGS